MKQTSEANDAPDSAGRELRLAAIRGDVDAVVYLLETGVSADSGDRYGFTPQMLAAKYGHFEVVRLLLGYGADVQRVNTTHSSAIRYPVERGYAPIVEALLHAGANANELYQYGAVLDLAICAHAADDVIAEIVRMLLHYGADPNRTTGRGVNALLGAAKSGQTPVVRELLRGGARFQTRRMFQMTMACSRVERNPELHSLLEPLDPERRVE